MTTATKKGTKGTDSDNDAVVDEAAAESHANTGNVSTKSESTLLAEKDQRIRANDRAVAVGLSDARVLRAVRGTLAALYGVERDPNAEAAARQAATEVEVADDDPKANEKRLKIERAKAALDAGQQVDSVTADPLLPLVQAARSGAITDHADMAPFTPEGFAHATEVVQIVRAMIDAFAS